LALALRSSRNAVSSFPDVTIGVASFAGIAGVAAFAGVACATGVLLGTTGVLGADPFPACVAVGITQVTGGVGVEASVPSCAEMAGVPATMPPSIESTSVPAIIRRHICVVGDAAASATVYAGLFSV